MPFDLNALINDPQFQTGLGLAGAGRGTDAMGNASPMLQAYNVLQAQKAAQQKAALDQATMELYKAHGANFAATTDIERQKLKQQDEMLGAFQNFMKQQQGGGSITQPVQPQGPAAQPQSLPPSAVPQGMQPVVQQTQAPAPELGKYGTPKAILANLRQVESGGKPFAIGPLTDSGEHALGPFQFLPSTMKTLKAQGIEFNAFDPQQAQDAADYYLQTLVRKNGGDYQKALAEYGGFKTKDSSSYVSRVLQGSPEAQARQMQTWQAQDQRTAGIQQIAQQAPQYLPEFNLGPGGVSIGMKPSFEGQKVDIQRQELDVKRQEANARTQEAGTGAKREGREAAQQTQTNLVTKTKDWSEVNSTMNNLDLLTQKTSQLIQHPGLGGIYGLSGAVPDIPGFPASDARALHLSVVNQIAKETLNAIRAASKTGGALGNVSDNDVLLLSTAVENLGKAQSKESAISAMKDVTKYTAQVRNSAITAYEKAHNESPIGDGIPVGTRYVGMYNGKPAYQAPNGKRFVLGE